MAKYKYVQSTAKLQQLLEKIQTIGVPEVADRKWLGLLGLDNKNDLGILVVLQSLGFVDANGRTVERWRGYRDSRQSKKVLAEGVRDAYSELFEMYPDADQRSDSELYNFFTSHSDAGQQAINKTVATFRALVSLADFSPNPEDVPVATDTSVARITPRTDPTTLQTAMLPDGGLTVNVNIQLVLPATSDEAIYDKFFAALRKHLISRV